MFSDLFYSKMTCEHILCVRHLQHTRNTMLENNIKHTTSALIEITVLKGRHK